jgi:hypothetical protein
MRRIILRLLLCCSFGFLSCLAVFGQENPVTNEYRVTIFPFHPITENLTGFGYLGYVNNPQKDYSVYYLGYPGVTYKIRSWFQLWEGLIGIYTNNHEKEDTLELRPFLGEKIFVPNNRKMNIFNFTRYEARNTYSHDTHDWTFKNRLRSRFGAEIPLTSLANAWKPKTFYGLFDVEPFWQLGSGLNMFRFRAGIAYIPKNRIRVELIYHTQWGQSTGGDALVYNQNIFRLNIKVGLKHGLLDKVGNPGA